MAKYNFKLGDIVYNRTLGEKVTLTGIKDNGIVSIDWDGISMDCYLTDLEPCNS